MAEPLRFQTIEIDEDGVAERTSDGHRPVFVPRAEVSSIALGRGFCAERPLVSLVLATACLLGGAYILVPAVPAFSPDYLRSRVSFILMGVMLVLAGVAFLRNALRRGPFLRVESASGGARKLHLPARFDRDALRDVLAQATSRFGYQVDLSSGDD